MFDGNEPLTFLCNTGGTTLADSLSRKVFRRGKGREGKDDTNLVFGTTSLHLVGNYLGAGLLGLGLVNELHQHTFVLVDVTLGLLVERVITGYGRETRQEKRGKDCAHRCLSILPASLYFLSSLRSTLCLLIHWTLVGIRASAVPFLLPVPVCLPFLLAARSSFVRARE